MGNQIGSGDSLGSPTAPGPSVRLLDLLHDEYGLPQHGGHFLQVNIFAVLQYLDYTSLSLK